MTFPQPDANQYMAEGQTTFRLFTPLYVGDIYESEQGAQGFAIGPNSDIAQVSIFYFLEPDQYLPVGPAVGQVAKDGSKMATLLITPDRAMIGRIDARMEDKYPQVNRPGRILIAPADLVDFSYLPETWNPTEDTLTVEQINLDVIQYLSPPSSVIPNRSDKKYTYQYLPDVLDPAGTAFLRIPAYGRKSGVFNFLNRTGGALTAVRVRGVRLSSSGAPGAVGSYEEELFSTGAFADNANDRFVFRASVDGVWDLFVICFDGLAGGAVPTTITLSDDPL